jgi:hypothetical protein
MLCTQPNSANDIAMTKIPLWRMWRVHLLSRHVRLFLGAGSFSSKCPTKTFFTAFSSTAEHLPYSIYLNSHMQILEPPPHRTVPH